MTGHLFYINNNHTGGVCWSISCSTWNNDVQDIISGTLYLTLHCTFLHYIVGGISLQYRNHDMCHPAGLDVHVSVGAIQVIFP